MDRGLLHKTKYILVLYWFQPIAIRIPNLKNPINPNPKRYFYENKRRAQNKKKQHISNFLLKKVSGSSMGNSVWLNFHKTK